MSQLKRLSEGRIFSAEKTRDGRICFMEECDMYFKEYLTADEVRELAKELLALAND